MDKELLRDLYNFSTAQQRASESINDVFVLYLPYCTPAFTGSLNIDSKPLWPSEDWNDV